MNAAGRIAAQGRFETGVLLRNGEQLLVSMILPLLALVAMSLSDVPSLGGNRRIDLVVPGVLALAVISTAFTGQAIALAFDRRNGVLRLLGTTPLGRSGLLWGKVLAVLVVLALQTLVLGVAGMLLGWQPSVAGVALALTAALPGVLAFVALATLVGGRLRAEAVLALANLLWVVFLGVGTLVPTAQYPEPYRLLVSLTPSGALGDTLRAAMVDARLDVVAIATLCAWALIFGILGRQVFRWSD